MVMAEPKESSSVFLRTIKEPGKSPVTFGFCKAFTVAVAITSIVMGSVYFRSCPAEYLIPYYLIISGISSIVFIVLASLPCRDGSDPSKMPIPLLAVQGVLSLFKLAFFIAGSVWIYSIYAPNYIDPSDQKYCHKGLYLYAFWITTVSYILLGLMVILSLCIQCFFCIWNCCGLFRKLDERLPQ